VKSSLRAAAGVAIGDELGCTLVTKEGAGVGCEVVQAGRNATASRRSRPMCLAFAHRP
jgi:hypothetical protein